MPTTPSSRLLTTGRPAAENTRSMLVFSGSVSAVSASSSRARASDTRCSSSSVAMPWWCMVSETANATSAVRLSSRARSKLASPTTRPSNSASSAAWSGPGSRVTRRASCSAAIRLRLKKRR